MNSDFTAVVQKVAGGYIAFVEECPGTGIYGQTFEETLYQLESTLAPLREHDDDAFSITDVVQAPCRSRVRSIAPGAHARRARTKRVLHS